MDCYPQEAVMQWEAGRQRAISIPKTRIGSVPREVRAGSSSRQGTRHVRMQSFEQEKDNENMFLRLKNILVRPVKLPPTLPRGSLNSVMRKREHQKIEEENGVRDR